MVLVTGATGILGRVILLELLGRGRQVRAAKRSSSDLDEVRASLRFYVENPDQWFSKIEWVNLDFQDPDSVKAALHGVTEVYHAAAQVSFDPADRKSLYKANVDGTAELLYACENSTVKKFCFISSMAVFDGLNEAGEIDENSAFDTKQDHSDYAISKHLAEMEVWRASAEGLDVVVVNPGIIIGSGNWKRSSGALFSNFEKNPVTFTGSSSYVDVRDVAFCSVQLMDSNLLNERYILVSETLPLERVTNYVRSKLGLQKLKTIPPGYLQFARWLKPFFGWLVPQLKLLTRSNIQAITSFQPVSNLKVRKSLDFEFIPVEEALDFHLKHYLTDKKQ